MRLQLRQCAFISYQFSLSTKVSSVRFTVCVFADKAVCRIRVVSPVDCFAGSFRPESFRPGFMGGSFRTY